MNAAATAAVLVACLGTGVIYGTDVFCALVLRPAAAAAREASIADLVGRIHHFGDRRLPVPGITAIVAAGAALAATTDYCPCSRTRVTERDFTTRSARPAVRRAPGSAARLSR